MQRRTPSASIQSPARQTARGGTDRRRGERCRPTPPRKLPHTHLPRPATELIGRERDVAAVARLMRSRRLVTLTGAAGSGKTRLSIAVATTIAHRYPDGAYLAPLEDTRDRGGVALAIARSLGLRERPDVPIEAAIGAHLRDGRSLLVLDNYEHVLATSPLVAALLAAAPALDLVVTSRAPLRLAGEQEFEVAPLEAEAGSALFLERARAVHEGFDPAADDVAAIAEIVERVDRLPLSIELAAAQMRLLTPAQILDRLDRHLPVLLGGPRDAPARQRTQRATLEWSHDLLSEPERRLYAGLSIFRGGWSIDAAEQVGGDDIGLDVYDGLTSLTEQNLVRSLTGAGPEPRFGMLNVVREDAATRLASSPSAVSVARAHAGWVLGLVEAAAPELERRDLRAWQQRIRIEEDNIRAALRWTIDRGEAEIGQRIAAACWRFWHYWGRSREGTEWLAAVLDLVGRLSGAATRARAHAAMGHLLRWQQRHREALEHFEQAWPILLATGDAPATADVLVRAFTAAADIGDFGRMRELIGEYGRLDGLGAEFRRWDEGTALALYEFMYMGVGSYEDRVLRHEARVEHLASIGRVLDSVEQLASVAWARAAAGRHQASLDASRQALRTFYELGHLGHLGLQLEFCARAELWLGHTERAVRLAVAAQRRADELGNVLAIYPTALRDPIEEGRTRLSAAAFARAVAEGEAMTIDEAVAFALSRRVAAARGRTRPADPGVLTDRESEVLALLIDGRSDAEIGDALFISPKTVSTHVFAIKGKLGAGSRAEIVAIAFRRGFATTEV